MSRILVHPPRGIPSKIVADYLDNCRRNLRPLNEAVARGDYEYIRVFGHKMKGVGGAYGFPTLSMAGAVIEQSAIARDTGAIVSQASAIEEYLGEIELVAD